MKTRLKKGGGRTEDAATAAFHECLPLFQALGDPHRQNIVLLLADEDTLNVNQIARHIPLSRPAISHHLKILRAAGLVIAARRGTENYYRLEIDAALDQLRRLVRQVERTCT